MFDHVALRVSDLPAARAFYETALATLGFGEPYEGAGFFEWEDLAVGETEADRPVTRNVHVGLVARSRADVDEFWRVLTDSGYRDDGAPGPRTQYSESYYGAFVLDPDGNSVEAVYHDDPRTDGGCVDHVWLRVRDVAASRGFYETVAPVFGWRVHERPNRVHFRGAGAGFSVTSPDDDWSVRRALTENLHLAFPAPDRATVEEFHRVAIAAGYRDNGAPGERPQYHEGYYGAFVLDPDGNNVEAVVHE